MRVVQLAYLPDKNQLNFNVESNTTWSYFWVGQGYVDGLYYQAILINLSAYPMVERAFFFVYSFSDIRNKALNIKKIMT